MQEKGLFKHVKASACAILFVALVWGLAISSSVQAKGDLAQNAPYIHFVNYHYVGNGLGGGTRDIIMEYAPDANGIFQISILEGQKSTCYVYQLKSDGLYELAYFDTYSDVEDKRYTESAKDDKRSLVLPSDLAVGKAFYSGYDKTIKNTIVANPVTYVINGKRYEDAIKVERELPEGKTYLYYAPKAGLIAVEDAEGHPDFVLTDTYGTVAGNR